jgi:hypothetical protein
MEDRIGHNEAFEQDELEPDLFDSYSVEKDNLCGKFATKDLYDNYSDSDSVGADSVWGFDDPEEDNFWTPSKRLQRPPVEFLVKHAPPPYPRTPLEPVPGIEQKYKAWCEKQEALEKAVKTAQLEINTAEDLLTQHEEKIKGLNPWASKANAVQIKQDLQQRVAKAKVAQAKSQKDLEEFLKSEVHIEKLCKAYVACKAAYVEFINVRNEGWKRVYGKVDPLRTTNQIVRWYSPIAGPIESKEDDTTYFEFPEYVDVSAVVRELLVGGHEYVQRTGNDKGLYLETSVLKKFAIAGN